MPVTNLPCGCIMTWGDLETDLAFCEEHDIDYEKWGWTDLEFIKMVATPKYATKRVDRTGSIELRISLTPSQQ